MNSISDLRAWWKSVIRPDRITDAIGWLRHEIADLLDAGTATVSVNAGATGWRWEIPSILVLGVVAAVMVGMVFAVAAALSKGE